MLAQCTDSANSINMTFIVVVTAWCQRTQGDATAVAAAHQLLAAMQARTEEQLKEAIEEAHKNADK